MSASIVPETARPTDRLPDPPTWRGTGRRPMMADGPHEAPGALTYRKVLVGLQKYAHLSAAHKRAAVDALDGLTPSMKPHEMASEMASKSESRPESAPNSADSHASMSVRA
jgi:hypothetical protein